MKRSVNGRYREQENTKGLRETELIQPSDRSLVDDIAKDRKESIYV